MQKRGQLTVFLLIGIFILAATAVFLYLRKDRAELGVAETIPPEFQPIKIYTEDCLLQYTQAAVLLLGTQGGYTHLPERIANNPDSAIAFSPNNPIKVPYWQYGAENRVPTIASMERAISDYLVGNINHCLRDYAPFKEKFSITQAESLTAKTTIGEDEVVVTLTMPLDATLKGSGDRTRMSKFNAQVPVKLRKIHRLAVEIFNAAAQQQFFEDLTIELMTAGTKIPFSDITLSCRKPKWKRSELEQELKDLLYYNLPRVRFAETRYPPFLKPLTEYEQFRGLTAEAVRDGNYPRDAPDDLYDYYHFYFPATDQDYADLTAGAFFLQDWQMRFIAKPSKGETLEASGGKGEQEFLRFLCVHAYHFTYDVEYPVQIVIRDPAAFSSGYAFRFAIPVRIKSNAPDHGGTSVTFFDVPENQEDYCEEQRDRETFIYAKDTQSGEELAWVNITFTCMNQFQCDVGSTAFDGNANRLRVKLPSFCRPGELRAAREGYLDAAVALTDAQYADIPMVPLIDKSFRVVKRQLSSGVLGDVDFLGEDEQAVLFLTAASQPEYSVQRRYPDTDLQTLPLLGGDATYDLKLMLLDTDSEPIGGWIGTFTLTAAQADSESSEIIFTAIEPQRGDEAALLEQISEEKRTAESKPVLR